MRLTAAQVASGLLPISFCDAVLSLHFTGFVRELDADVEVGFACLSAQLAVPVASLLLSTAFGAFSEHTSERGSFIGLHRGLIYLGLLCATGGQLVVAMAGELMSGVSNTGKQAALSTAASGLALYAVARAALVVAVHARAAEVSNMMHFGSSFALISLTAQLGELLGQMTAAVQWGPLGYFAFLETQFCSKDSLCFEIRVGMLCSVVFTGLGCSLAASADISTNCSRQCRRPNLVHDKDLAQNPRYRGGHPQRPWVTRCV